MAVLEEALAAGSALDFIPDLLMELNSVAMSGIVANPGAYRQAPMLITNSEHRPPPPEDVQRLVEDMCAYVATSWNSATATHLAAYVMWRVNWIHPFSDGNGRTSRLAAYIVLCARIGYILPGSATVPAMIAESKRPYYEALHDCDVAWRGGRLDISPMERLLGRYLERQLRLALDEAENEADG